MCHDSTLKRLLESKFGRHSQNVCFSGIVDFKSSLASTYETSRRNISLRMDCRLVSRILGGWAMNNSASLGIAQLLIELPMMIKEVLRCQRRSFEVSKIFDICMVLI